MSVVPATPQLAPLSEQHFSPVETFERQLSTACRRSPPEVNDVAAVGVSDGGGGLGGSGLAAGGEGDGGGGLGAGLGLAATIRCMRVRSDPRLMLKPQKSPDVSLQPAHACKVTLSSFIADIVIDGEV